MYSSSTLRERRSKHFTTINTFKFTEPCGCVGGKLFEFPFQEMTMEREELSGNTQGCKSERCTWVHWFSLDSSPGIPTVQQWSLRRPPAAFPSPTPQGPFISQDIQRKCVYTETSWRGGSDLTQCLTHCPAWPSHEALIQPLLECMCVRAMLLQSCLTLCNPTDYSPPGFSVHGILQARILE